MFLSEIGADDKDPDLVWLLKNGSTCSSNSVEISKLDTKKLWKFNTKLTSFAEFVLSKEMWDARMATNMTNMTIDEQNNIILDAIDNDKR